MVARFLTCSVVLLAVGFCGGDDKKDDKDLLQGEWTAVSAEIGGKAAANFKDLKLVVKGDEWTPPSGGKGGKFSFKIDQSKNPKQLDLKRTADGKESTWAGIYKIEGDTLTFCRPQSAGGKRPTEFKGGPEVVLMVFKRAGK